MHGSYVASSPVPLFPYAGKRGTGDEARFLCIQVLAQNEYIKLHMHMHNHNT